MVRRVPLVDEAAWSSTGFGRRNRCGGGSGWGHGARGLGDIEALELGGYSDKGEALWKSLLVTTGDVLVFIDSDLTQ